MRLAFVSLEPGLLGRQGPLAGAEPNWCARMRSAATACHVLIERRMNRHIAGIVLAFVSAVARPTAAQQVDAALTPDEINEAIQLAADEKTARKFLEAYVVQARAGRGNGPRIGAFSTPFSRVVQATLAARTRGSGLTAADIPSELIAPELHVIAVSQPAAGGDSNPAGVVRVTLVSRGQSDSGAVEPLKTGPLTATYQALNGTAFQEPGTVTVFPLRALTTGAEIRVVYDRTAAGSTPSSMCRECVVPLDLRRIR